MTMLRIGSMNLMLHGIAQPNFRYTDSLSKAFDEEKCYDVVLANPPFKGAIDSADVNPTLPTRCKKTEILFLHLFLRLLESGGRAAVIVPDGVLFGTSNAHVEIRRMLVEENRLDAVVSMPSGVFRPYAGVSTAVLVFTKGGNTERIWFYDMEHDGFSLDDKRQKVPENDIPDLLECWKHRRDVKFTQKRTERLADLEKQIAPLKAERLKLHADIHRLTFEAAIADEQGETAARETLDTDQQKLDQLHDQIAPLQKEINSSHPEKKMVRTTAGSMCTTLFIFTSISEKHTMQYSKSLSEISLRSSDSLLFLARFLIVSANITAGFRSV